MANQFMMTSLQNGLMIPINNIQAHTLAPKLLSRQNGVVFMDDPAAVQKSLDEIKAAQTRIAPRAHAPKAPEAKAPEAKAGKPASL